jgi:hypothetical protein
VLSSLVCPSKSWTARRVFRPPVDQCGLCAPQRVYPIAPGWMVDSLDREARRMGVTRQSLIKLWLADKLGEKTAASNAGVDPQRSDASVRLGIAWSDSQSSK